MTDVREKLVSLATAIGPGRPESDVLDEAALLIDHLRESLARAEHMCEQAMVACDLFGKSGAASVVGLPAPVGTRECDAYKILRHAADTYMAGDTRGA